MQTAETLDLDLHACRLTSSMEDLPVPILLSILSFLADKDLRTVSCLAWHFVEPALAMLFHSLSFSQNDLESVSAGFEHLRRHPDRTRYVKRVSYKLIRVPAANEAKIDVCPALPFPRNMI